MANTADATQKCPYCGQPHIGLGTCPHVRAIEYHPNGSVKRVEFAGPPQIIPMPVGPSWPQYPWQGPFITSTNGDLDHVGAMGISAVTALLS